MQGKKNTTSLSLSEKEVLGRSTWHLLHTLAWYYPDKPSHREKKAVQDLISALGVLYPCRSCAGVIDLFRQSKLLNPSTRASLALSFCEFHNLVNSKLNKPIINCSTILSTPVQYKRKTASLLDVAKEGFASVMCKIRAFYTR